MSLYVKTLNPESTAPELFMVHGWAMHSGVWMDFATHLSQSWRISVVDLPGHGDSIASAIPAPRLEDWAQALLAAAPEKSVWLGWSLGGLIAQQAAILAPHRLQGLALVSSTPCFTHREDWPHAVDAGVFRQFAENLSARFESTLVRFLSLQIKGSKEASSSLRHLRETLLAKPPADGRALDRGLQLLLQSDLRTGWCYIQCPVLALFGEQDTLVPAAAAQSLLNLGDNIRAQVLPGAGHAAFLSHLTQVIESVNAIVEPSQVAT